ncbi:hypothetical protein M405DRAFT_822646, partial [Rhizopogon salebrosus TDB-379]
AGKSMPSKDQSTQHHPECYFLKLLTAVHLQDIRVLPRKRCCPGRGVENGPPDGKEDT